LQKCAIAETVSAQHCVREKTESSTGEEIGTGDKSVFGKRSLFWLKFEYVVFVTLLVT
jgi:hypothetical protein